MPGSATGNRTCVCIHTYLTWWFKWHSLDNFCWEASSPVGLHVCPGAETPLCSAAWVKKYSTPASESWGQRLHGVLVLGVGRFFYYRHVTWRMGSQDLDMWLNKHGDRCCPLTIGLWDPFQMASFWLINGGYLVPLKKSTVSVTTH